MIRTDIFQRGVPWMLLMKRSRVAETDLNVRRGQKVCVAATGLAAWRRSARRLVPLAARARCRPAWRAIVALNRDFYRFLARRRGWGFAVGVGPATPTSITAAAGSRS